VSETRFGESRLPDAPERPVAGTLETVGDGQLRGRVRTRPAIAHYLPPLTDAAIDVIARLAWAKARLVSARRTATATIDWPKIKARYDPDNVSGRTRTSSRRVPTRGRLEIGHDRAVQVHPRRADL
jgi:hypothetical protein